MKPNLAIWRVPHDDESDLVEFSIDKDGKLSRYGARFKAPEGDSYNEINEHQIVLSVITEPSDGNTQASHDLLWFTVMNEQDNPTVVHEMQYSDIAALVKHVVNTQFVAH